MRSLHAATLLAGAALVIALAGCASPAHVVERTPTGGTVAVPDYQHRSEALALIREEAGPNYSIVDEKTVETGLDTKTVTEAGTGSLATRISSWFTGVKQVAKTDTKTEKSTEWRITYEVKPGNSPPAIHP
jgi:hypothetical protein